MSELRIEAPSERDGALEVAATLTTPAGSQRLWYLVESEHASDLTSGADPFVIATIHQAMSVGEPLHVVGRVSPSLLRNLEVFQRAWSQWKPGRYRPIEVRATAEAEADLPPRSEAISGFSGGVDSCFTAFRHSRAATTRFPIRLRASVMVQGFDIPLGDEVGFGRASERARQQLDGLGLEMYRVRTNFRQQPVDWVDSFGTGVASVLALFQGRFRTGLIAQGVPFGAYRSIVEGSNPLTDPLLSSDAFSVVPDGADFQRTEKLAAMAEWAEGLAHLRVCWRNTVRWENCCVCEKCIRNILAFRAAGIKLPPSFPLDVSDSQILGLVPIKDIKLSIAYEPIEALAMERGLADQPWVRVLSRAIQLSRFHKTYVSSPSARGVWKLIRRFRGLGLPSARGRAGAAQPAPNAE